jgi:hypothetical protein
LDASLLLIVGEMGGDAMRVRVLCCAAAVGVAGAARGQSNATFLIEVSNVVTPSSPEATVSLFAAWDEPSPGDFVFGGTNLDMVAWDGEWTAVIPRLLFTCGCYGTTRGNRIDGLSIGQIHLPPMVPGRPGNPIHLYDFMWVATDFTPRSVPLHTENTRQFRVSPAAGGVTIDLMATFRPGSASIRVVPGVGGAPLLVIGGLAFGRQRRRKE